MTLAAALHFYLSLLHRPPLQSHGKPPHLPEYTAHFHSLTLSNTTHSKENQISSQQSQGQLQTTVSFNQTSLAPDVHEAHPNVSRPQGYLLAVAYEQQLTAALLGFAQLSKIADSLNLFFVEPFVQNSQLKGVPVFEGKLTKPFWKLGMLYNISEMQKSLEGCISSYKLSNIEQMVRKASRKVIVVFLMTSASDELGDKQIIIKDNDSKRSDAGFVVHILNVYVYYWLKQTNLFQHYGHSVFHLSKVIMINARPFHPTSFGSIREALLSVISIEVAKEGSATVLVEKWRGIHTTNGSKFFYFMPDFSWDEDECDLYALQASNLVIKAAHNFSLHVNLSRPQIGIHIRGERLLIDSRGNTSYYITCLEQLKTLLKTLLNHYGGTNKNVIVFHDLGPYGSRSCTRSYCLEGRADFLSILETYNFPIRSYNPAKLKYTPQSPAFASFVEREFLSHVDVLITLGRGGFQQSIVERFLTNGARQKDLYRLCF